MTDAPASLRAAEEFFHQRIPLTRAMALRVVPDDRNRFAIEAPVAANHNHLQTAFGGSINAVATLAGYALVWLELQGADAHLLIRESSIRFLQPVRETIRAVCLPPAKEELEKFRSTLRAKRKARLSLEVLVEENGRPAARFSGTFVAVASSGDQR